MHREKTVPVSGHSDGDALSSLLKIDFDPTLTVLSDGVQAAYEGSDRAWLGAAEGVASSLAATGAPFTVDDIRRYGLGEPDKPQRWGSLFAALQARGTIRLHGLTLHRTQGGESKSLRVWIGGDSSRRHGSRGGIS